MNDFKLKDRKITLRRIHLGGAFLKAPNAETLLSSADMLALGKALIEMSGLKEGETK
jgi:hypothetical protein